MGQPPSWKGYRSRAEPKPASQRRTPVQSLAAPISVHVKDDVKESDMRRPWRASLCHSGEGNVCSHVTLLKFLHSQSLVLSEIPQQLKDYQSLKTKHICGFLPRSFLEFVIIVKRGYDATRQGKGSFTHSLYLGIPSAADVKPFLVH